MTERSKYYEAPKEENRASEEETRNLRTQKRARKEAKHASMARNHEVKPLEGVKRKRKVQESSKKRKQKDDIAGMPAADEILQKNNKKNGGFDQPALPPSLDNHDKYYTKNADKHVSWSDAAAQRNANALTGKAARKEKLLRLLGAGKTNAAVGHGLKRQSTAEAAGILRVQIDLERQYEAGRRMRHDGAGKRRGIGA